MTLSWKPVLAVSLFLIAVVAGIVLTIQHRQPGQGTVVIAGRTLRVDVAATEATREQGLSGRERLGPAEGMLFLFPAASQYAFWMKDMHFSIDIIWIAGDKVVDLSVEVPPPTPGQELLRYRPIVAADKVLEVPAGFAREAGLRVGMPVDIRIDR